MSFGKPHSSGGQNSEIKVSTAPCFLWNLQRVTPSLLLLASGVSCHPWSSLLEDASFQYLVTETLYPCVSLPSFYEDISHAGLKAHPTIVWLRLNQLYLQPPYFLRESQPEVLWVRLQHNFGGRPNSTHNRSQNPWVEILTPTTFTAI